MTEWKTIPGHDDHYLVSDDGRVFSKYVQRELARNMSGGYLVCHIINKDGNKVSARIHRLVAIAFIGYMDNLYVNHKNGNKQDNRLCNIEWVTPSENMLHSVYEIDNGNNVKRGSQLSEHEIEQIRELIESGETIGSILEKFNISGSMYKRIFGKKKRLWKFSEKEIPTLENEIVKKVVGYDYYYVSNLGNIYSSSRGKKMIPYEKNGYYFTHLYSKGKSRNVYMHRLVAEHFVDNPNNLDFVNHINENKKDNAYTNLEWVTRSQNLKHSMRKTRTISNETIDSVLEYINLGNTEKDAAIKFGISKTSVGRIKHKTGRFSEQ